MEGFGVVFALLLALVVAGRLAHTGGRGEMLFLDGDSQAVRLLVRSLLSGEPMDWAMSPVLFIPESVIYALLIASGLDMHGMSILAAVANFGLLYACIRFVSARGFGAVSGIIGALAAFSAFCASTFLEGAGDRNSLELSSLMMTMTYYSGTVLGVLLLLGFARRAVSNRPLNSGIIVTVVTLVSAVSTLTNPLFVAWGTLPILVICAFFVKSAARRSSLYVFAASSIVGALLGYVARTLFSQYIVADNSLYFQPARAADSLAYYWSLLVDRATTVSGALALVCVTTLLVANVVLSFRLRSSRSSGDRLVLAYAWVGPITCALGFILLGTQAARYLQPWAFAPVLGLSVWASVRRLPVLPKRAAIVGGIAYVTTLAVVGAALIGTSLPDRSLSCVTSWVNHQDRTGAGQFWSIRAIKANVDDPDRLLQVDPNMNGYGWLVNRADFDVRSVHYLITDSQSFEFQLPLSTHVAAPKVVDCGRWTIADYGDEAIPVGPVWP